MKPLIIIPLLLASIQAFAQEKDLPYVRFREGAIVWYLPSSGQQFQSLPAYIPGFVHIRQTLFIQKLTKAQVTTRLSEELTTLANTTLSTDQKLEFLEKYACLILLNYLEVNSLPQEFFSKTKELKSDTDQSIRSDAELVVNMFEMYESYP
jgi:hypothetical protein